MAIVVEKLIAYGHNDPYKYTPKQAQAYFELAIARRSEELREYFVSTQNAMHADKKGAEKFLKEIGNDG